MSSATTKSLRTVEAVAQHVGTFTVPIRLPAWAVISLSVAGALAAMDRALRLKSTWMAG